MRAELLRMTEDLRKIIGDDAPKEDVLAEGEILISTRVEPVIREAAHHADELIKKKYRSFLKSLPKTIGLVGLGFFDPVTFSKAAITESLYTSNRLAEMFGEPKPPTATARVVLEMRRNR